jgi:hypothetical protein
MAHGLPDPTQQDRLGGEEIAGQDLVFVVRHQVTPTRGTSTLKRRRDIVPLQDACDGSRRNGLPKFIEFSADLVVAPVEILSGESDDEAFKRWIYLQSPSTATAIVRPFPT